MSTMIRQGLLFTILLQVTQNVLVQSAQQVPLSNSYLPVAMQIIAHLTDQMAFEVKEDVPPRTSTTTPKPLYVTSGYYDSLTGNGWLQRYRMARDITTPFHKPGLFAPSVPPKPTDKGIPKNQNYVLLPVEHNAQYTIIEPLEKKPDESLLAAHNEEVKPLVEPRPNLPHHFLPYKQDIKARRSDGYDDLDEDSLQYLSQNVRDMIRMANDPDDDRVVDVWDGVRAGPSEVSSRGKLSSSNLRLLLLYDLLSREAKKQRLSDYSGFSPAVMKALAESSGGGARAQLSAALAGMVDRRDCGHEYANNRAREMVAELARDDSTLSSEIRYLQPLVYKI